MSQYHENSSSTLKILKEYVENVPEWLEKEYIEDEIIKNTNKIRQEILNKEKQSTSSGEKKDENKEIEVTVFYEMLNAISHGLAFIALIPLGIILIYRKYHNSMYFSWLSVLSYLIYIIGFEMLYLSSTLLHFFVWLKNKKILKILQMIDHSCISIVIASCYTPFMMNTLRDCWVGLVVFTIEWVLVILNIIFFIKGWAKLEITVFLIMGWMALLISPVIFWIIIKGYISWIGFFLILLGGVCYSLGVVFYILGKKKHQIFHVIWHFFVIGGCLFQYFAMYFYDDPHKEVMNSWCSIGWFR